MLAQIENLIQILIEKQRQVLNSNTSKVTLY